MKAQYVCKAYSADDAENALNEYAAQGFYLRNSHPIQTQMYDEEGDLQMGFGVMLIMERMVKEDDTPGQEPDKPGMGMR